MIVIYCVNCSSIVAGLIVLVMLSTWHDFRLKDDQEHAGSTLREFVLCFSARRNFNSIIETTSGHPGLQTIHFIRFIWTTLVIIGHRTVQYWVGPLINPNYIESVSHRKLMLKI